MNITAFDVAQRFIGIDEVSGFDVVILRRGTQPQSGPEIIDDLGHVGFYAGHQSRGIELLGGNQGRHCKGIKL